MELTRDGIVKLLQARRDSEQAKIYPLTLFTTSEVISIAANNNAKHQMVVNVLDEMIGAITTIQAKLDEGAVVWPMDVAANF